MRPRQFIYFAAVVGLAACLALVTGCSSQKVDAVSNIAPAVKVEQAPDPNLITPDKPERFPLVTATSRAEVSELIANGSVAPDVSRTVPVNALIGRPGDRNSRAPGRRRPERATAVDHQQLGHVAGVFGLQEISGR